MKTRGIKIRTNMKISRKFIAEQAGVSPTTVSDVMNRNPKARISSEVAAKVREIAEKYGYSPDQSARALVTGRTYNIGIIYRETIATVFDDPFRASILRGVEESIDENAYNLVFVSNMTDAYPSDSFRRCICGKSVDGILAFGPMSDIMVDMIHNKGIPCVFMDYLFKHRQENCVLPDNFQSTYKAAKYLIGCGCKKIWFLFGTLHFFHITNEERPAGYAAAMDEAGLKAEILEVSPRADLTKDMMLKIFAEKGFPDAIMTAGDKITMGAYLAIQQMKPEQLEKTRLIGFDDLPCLAQQKPAISAIHTNIDEIGKEAVKLLMARIENPLLPPQVHRLSTSLVIRET